MIQTFGTKDTKIEIYSANGTLLTSDDDSGYGLNALKSYYFAANTRYRIRVKFYSGSVYGTTKLAITPSNGQYSTSTLSSYEGIYSISGRTSFSSKLYAEPNSTKIMTFTPSSAGSYTFKIDSSADTYIYVIDPRTNTTLIRGQHYDDDSGEGLNTLLTTNLTAGIPYLIIYSTYNPGSLTSRVDLTLAVKKN